MYRYLIALVLLAACGNNATHQDISADSSTPAGHDMHANTHMDDAMAQAEPDPLRDMHQAMTIMMDSMHAYKPTGNADRDFAYLMRQHHLSAVAMAKAETGGGTDSALVQLARNIIRDQQSEVARFDAFLQQPAPQGSSDYGKKAMGMMGDMGAMESGSIDRMFASMMIPHHQDGVKMATAYLKEGKDTSLLGLARNILRTQPGEVRQMQAWLAAAK